MRGANRTIGKDSDSIFKDLLESAPDAMVIVDGEGIIQIVNSQAEKLFGYLRSELYGQNVEILLPDSAKDVHVQHRWTYQGDPHVRPMGKNLDLFAKCKNGDLFPVEISLSPLRTDDGNYVSSVIRDITENKRHERELRDAREKADKAHSANTAFLAAASHDLRQPVQALLIQNGALRRTVADESAMEIIDSQQQSLMAMTNLLNSLLDISRLSSGTIQPRLCAFSMQQLLAQISTDFERRARLKNLDLSIDDSNLYVHSDPDLLAEIIQNLVSNAIRYTDKGYVRITCEIHGNRVRVCVEDTGIGLQPNQIQRIFDEYFQVENSTTRSEGFGLGLAIVRRLADLLNISIDVVSEPDKGSTFSFDIDAASKAEINRLTSAPVQAAAIPVQGNVVLIEDNDAVAKALATLLESEGLTVAVARDVEEAVAAARQMNSPAELIISDFHLKGGDNGLDAVTAVRRFVDDLIPAIIITGDTTPIVKTVQNLANSTLLRKPVDPDDLIACAQQAITSGEVKSSVGS